MAELLVTMDSPPWYFRWVQHMPGHHQMRKTILEFSGIRPVRVHSFGPVRGACATHRARWLAQARAHGQRNEHPAHGFIGLLYTMRRDSRPQHTRTGDA